MEDQVERYIEIRTYLESYLREFLEIYFTDIWDPMMKYIIIKETKKLLKNDLSKEFADFPKEYLPKVKFRIFEEYHEIEAGVQIYFNQDPDLTFLGSSELGGSAFDYYLGNSFDPATKYKFYARYGHSIDSIYSGSRVASAEYFQGMMTPLSVAFGMAVEDGFIS